MASEPFNLPYYNNTNYPLALKNQLEKIEYTDEISKKLKFSQHIPKEFYIRSSNIRGILFAHAMGQGKTRLAVAISEHFRDYDPKRRVIVLLPKSLENNFRDNLTKYNNRDEEYQNANYKFISLNSSRMFKQIESSNKSEKEIAYEKQLGSFMDDIIKKNALENSLLIIDEAHNLFNAITNGAKNATALYDLIMKTRNIKIIFLTGTPIINDPFELVPCFNMCRGLMEMKDLKNKNKQFTTLFSEDRDDFENFFIDREKKTIKNKEKFSNRIFGLTSYYGDLYFSEEGDKKGFPKELPIIVENIHMSETQFAVYIVARQAELEETKRVYKGQNARFSSSSGGNSTYRVKTRQISNYAIPDYALGPVRGMKSRKKFINKIKLEDLLDLQKYSPKFDKIISNINKRNGQPGIVYSQFVSGEGLAIFAKVLEAKGYKNALNNDDNDNGFDIKEKNNRSYAMLSGEISPDERDRIIKKFNSKDNIDASKIQILLLSSAVAEGIDLKRVRHVHIMEPFWNYARINQVKTRAIRYESHIDLPVNEQNVQIYIYLSDYPKTYSNDKMKELTTDKDLYQKSIDNMQIIDSFMMALAETSIDCKFHHSELSDQLKEKIKCKLCSPNNMQLFDPIFNKDMELPSNCIPYQETKINVNEIIIEETGEKYYYKKDNDDIQIYSYNQKLDGYTPMPRSHKFYGQIMEKILSN